MTLIRSALYNLFFFASTFFLCVWGGLLLLFAPDRVMGLVRTWARVELAGARVLCGIRFTVSGADHLADEPLIIASQHQSTFDTLVWFLLVPRCAYVLKKELTRVPVFAALLRTAGMIVVDRKGGAAALRRLVRDGRQAIAAGRQVVIFPEGTRAEPGSPLPVQPGIAALAAVAGAPVIPVVTDSGRVWGRRAFRKRRGLIHIDVRPPLAPGLSREAMIDRLGSIYRGGYVDKSVGEPLSVLADGCSDTRQHAEVSE